MSIRKLASQPTLDERKSVNYHCHCGQKRCENEFSQYLERESEEDIITHIERVKAERTIDGEESSDSSYEIVAAYCGCVNCPLKFLCKCKCACYLLLLCDTVFRH